MDPLLSGLIAAATVVLVELGRLMREKRLRRHGEKRTRAEDESAR